MAKNTAVWGLDIGQCALKAIRCRPGDSPETIVADAFDYIEYPKILSQPEADPVELVRDALKTFLSRNTVKGDRVAVSVSGQSGLARFIKLPPVESKKIPDIVRYEARQQIPFALEEVIWDYQKLGGGIEEDGFSMETEVGLFAMKRDQVFRALKPFMAAKIEVDIVQLAPLAVYNWLAFDQLRLSPDAATNPDAESVVILSMGTDTTDLVVTNGFRVWQRSIPLGGSHFTKALTKEMKLTFAKAEHLKRNAMQAEDPRAVFQAMRPVFNDLVTEIQRSIGYFKSIDRTAKVGRIVALGNAMKLPGLQKFLTQHLDTEVVPATQFKSLGGDAVLAAPAFKSNLLSFAPAYGLAVQGLGRGRLRTNLMPRELITRRIIREKKPWAVAAVAALLLGCVVNYYGYWRAWKTTDLKQYETAFSQAQSAVSEATNFNSQFDGVVSELKSAVERGGQVVGNVEKRVLWLELWKAVNACLPKPIPLQEQEVKDIASADAISQREEIFITKFTTQKFEDLATWYQDMQMEAPPGWMPSSGGSRGYGAMGYGAMGYGAGAGSQTGAGADMYGGAGAFSDSALTEEADAEGEGAAGSGPTGPGWVVELQGYHYHNGEKFLTDEGAEFLRRVLLKKLNGETPVSLEIPVPGAIPDPQTGQVPVDTVTVSDLGIGFAGEKWSIGPQPYPIVDPTAAINPVPATGGEGRGTTATAASTMMEDPMIKLMRYDFIVQFAWVPKTRTERLEAQKAKAEAAAAEAANEGGEGGNEDPDLGDPDSNSDAEGQ